ncbi:MAG: Glu-tRNA(Gln) amidotransferase subunit GatE [Phycisphaerae bacterium]
MAFEFKPFDRMTPEDYAAIGFRCGLEVHQQLLTERKLFCHCPAGRYGDDFDAEVLRHMRPTLSELGEYDGTALMEKKTRKNIYYRIHRDTVCTYEFDDTPPFFPDARAIDIALEIALLCNLNLVGEMHIARKQYLDGSIPAGFQRTAILGVGGWVPYRDGKIDIRQLSIEEDACREVSDIGHERVYLTDRLGMPLIEIVTEPQMVSPKQAAEVCGILRLLCRGTHRVRTGYGATRQDVNVSVRGGTRIEIKGVPQISRIPLLVYNEARRQCGLLYIRDQLRDRGITADSLRWTVHNVTRTVAKTPFQPIRETLAASPARGRVKCVVLEGFAGLLNQTIQEHTPFAKEFSDRVRVIACLTTLPNMVHSDATSELLSVRDWKELRRVTRAGDKDTLVLAWGNEEDTQTACEEIVIRAREATEGIPSDTRQGFKDGTNGFERVLPGAERMYPDTDLPPIAIARERVEQIRSELPERVWDRLGRYRRMRLPGDVTEPLAISSRADLFDRVVNELGVDVVFAAVVLVQRFKAWRREQLDPRSITDDELFELFRAHSARLLSRKGLLGAIERLLRVRLEGDADGDSLTSILNGVSGEPMGDADLREAIDRVIRSVDAGCYTTVGKKHRHLIGRLVAELPGSVEGGDISRMLAERMGIGRADTAAEEVAS